MTENKNILFDLDGTLTDSREGIIRCFQYALDRLKLPCPEDAQLDQYIGPPLAESFRQLLATNDTDRIDEAVTVYRERFSVKGLYENRVYQGIPDLLARLSDEGNTLFVATAKAEHFAEIIIDHFNLSPFFKGVYGAAADSTATGKTGLVRDLLTKEDLAAEETFMVGDRKHDITAALNNGVTATGVLWGYGSAQELRLAGAQYLFGEPHEVSNLLLIL